MHARTHIRTHAHRLLRLIEMPALDSVLSHDAVDGKDIVQNAVQGLVPRFLRSGLGHRHSHPNRPPSRQATSGQGEWSPVHTTTNNTSSPTNNLSVLHIHCVLYFVFS